MTKVLIVKVMFATLLLFGQLSKSFADDIALTEAASQLIESMSLKQKDAGLFGFKDKDRANWSNLPPFLAPTEGVELSKLSDMQRGLVFRILQTTLSSQGYHKSSQIIWLDDLLKEIETKTIVTGVGNVQMARLFVDSRGSGKYKFAIFGNPDHGE